MAECPGQKECAGSAVQPWGRAQGPGSQGGLEQTLQASQFPGPPQSPTYSPPDNGEKHRSEGLPGAGLRDPSSSVSVWLSWPLALEDICKTHSLLGPGGPRTHPELLPLRPPHSRPLPSGGIPPLWAQLRQADLPKMQTHLDPLAACASCPHPHPNSLCRSTSFQSRTWDRSSMAPASLACRPCFVSLQL